jgi:hypothetical protein
MPTHSIKQHPSCTRNHANHHLQVVYALLQVQYQLIQSRCLLGQQRCR